MAEATRYELSDLDKMGIMKTVKLVLFYELQPTVDVDRLISSVTEGVKNATRQLPLMAGSIQFDGVKPYIETSTGKELEVDIRRVDSIKDQAFASFATLAGSSFSPSDVDLAQFLPDEPAASQRPVCLLRISVIEGGLVLGLRMNHAAGDWASIDTFLSLICQSSKAHQEGLELPVYSPDLNRAPYNTPAPDPAISRHDHLKRLPIFYVMEKSQFKPPPPPLPSRSSIYRISEPTIQQLKIQCAPHLTTVDYISSYDCISALVWKSLTRARLLLHPEKTTSPSRFVHPIDVRSRDPEKKTSDRYFGNAVIGCQAGPLSAEAVVSDGDRGLAAAATLIRESSQSVDLSTIGHMTSLLASLGPTETLGSNVEFANMDLFMNTWYSGSAHKYDLGAGATPVACRPHDTPAGSCMILPNFSRGETRVFEVLITTTVEESEKVRKDVEFLKYFEPVV